MQSRPVPLTSGSAVGARRPRPREPVLVLAPDVISESPPASPLERKDDSPLATKPWTSPNNDKRSDNIEISAGPAPTTLTPNGSKMIVDEEAGSVPLSPAMTKALDEGAEKRKRLARDRGRRKAEARMKEGLADHALDEAPSADKKGADALPEAPEGASETRSVGSRPGPLPPLRGARTVRSEMVLGGEQAAEEVGREGKWGAGAAVSASAAGGST